MPVRVVSGVRLTVSLGIRVSWADPAVQLTPVALIDAKTVPVLPVVSAVTVTAVDSAPSGITTEAGTARAEAFVLDRFAVTPPAGAA